MASAAVKVTVDTAEAELRGATGLDIHLPRKFTVEAIGQSLYDLLPTDITQALDMAMALAAQGAAQIVAGLLAETALGAAATGFTTLVTTGITTLAVEAGVSAASAAALGGAVGSVIPGFGTVIGIGAALLVNELGLFKPVVRPMDRECKTHSNRLSTSDGNAFKRSPLDLLPYAYTSYIELTNAIEKERAVKYCGKGLAIEHRDLWSGALERLLHAFTIPGVNALGGPTWDNTARFVPDIVVGTLGLPRVKKLLRTYRALPTKEFFFNTQTHKLSSETSGYHKQLIQPLIRALETRQHDLEELVATKFLLGKSSALRWLLVTELNNATTQVVLETASEYSKAWLLVVAELYKKLVALELSEQNALAAATANNQKLYAAIQKDPVAKAKLELQSLRFNCNECDLRPGQTCAPCDELHRRLTAPAAITTLREVKVHVPRIT